MAQIVKENKRWLVSGDMTIAHMGVLLAESASLAQQSKTLDIDLSAVSDVDTFSISLLFEWLRTAHGHGCSISFSNLPHNLLSLANLYGVVELLPLSSH